MSFSRDNETSEAVPVHSILYLFANDVHDDRVK